MTTKQFAVAAVLLGLGFATASDAEAQQRKRYALFISGYGSAVWDESGTPKDWKRRGIVDDYEILDAVVEDKLEELARMNISSTSDLIGMIGHDGEELYEKMVNWYIHAPAYANTELVIVGHSAGGYLARALGSLIESYGADFVAYGTWRPSVTVVTLGTPHQGARLAGKSEKSIRSLMDEWIDVVERPLGHAHWTISLGARVKGKSGDIRNIPEMLDTADDQVNVWTSKAELLPLKQVFAPGGLVPKGLQRLGDPQNYLSVYGAEKSRTAVRMAGELTPEYGGYGDEVGMYNQYEELRGYYVKNRDAWNAAAAYYYATGRFWKGPGAKKKANRWKEGERKLKAIDDLWTQVIDSYTTTRRTGYRRKQVCIPQDGGRGPLDPATPIAYRLQTRMRECARGESAYRYTPYSYTVTVETKNDGVMGPQYGVWDKAQMARYAVDVTGSSNNGNSYLSDLGDDGGYNHMELRRSKRAYSKGGVFSKGDANPPVEGVERWMKKKLKF